MPEIHPTAIVDRKTELADDMVVGPFSIIQGDVAVGPGCRIHLHVLIADGVRIGRN